MRTVATVAAVAVVLLCGVPANAGVIYDNGIPDLSGGSRSDFDVEETSSQTADDFTLNGPATVRDIHWWGFFAGYGPSSNTPPAGDDFTIRFYQIDPASGGPQAVPFYTFHAGNVGRSASGFVGPFPLFAYETAIPDLVLSAGTHALSIVNDTTADTDDSWYWAVSHDAVVGGSGKSWTRHTEESAWTERGLELAFVLTDDGLAAVPEPATLLLLGTGLVGLGVTTWRRARRN